MVLVKRGEFSYGDSQSDIVEVIRDYSSEGYPAEHFADAVCDCGGRSFRLVVDDNVGAAVRTCVACAADTPIGDSADYLDDAELEECECPCGSNNFQITAGVSLYTDDDAVRWLYLGCRCPACGLTAVYADWKNEYPGYQEFLSRV